MSFTAQNKIFTSKTKVTTLIMGVVTLLSLSSSLILAGDVQVCNTSSSCTIGEFLYDDEYNPDLTATCTLSTKNPDGTNHLSSQNLTVTADGWYGHTFTASTTTGYYRGELCCDTTGGDHMCLDKSFEVKEEVSGSSSLTNDGIAEAVWGYSSRTLTGFNNIVSDVWGYATRTLTSGANITTTLSTTQDATLTEVKKTSDETRLLLEQLINKPIIENSLEEVNDIDLGERIEKSKLLAKELSVDLLILDTDITRLNKDWSKLNETELIESLNDINIKLGDSSDSSSDLTVFAKINYIKDTWGLKETDDLTVDIKAVKSSVDFTLSGLTSYGKTTTLKKELTSSKRYIETSEKTLSSLNKKLVEIENLTYSLDQSLNESNKILSSWDSNNYQEAKTSIDSLYSKVVAINKLPKGIASIDSSYSDIPLEKKLKNKVLGLRGLLFANKKLLVTGSSNKLAFVANWLEEGSLVIKTLITNPSNLITQEVPLKYYLPMEVKKEHVIDVDAGLEVKYDTEKDQYYIEGNFTLKPSETKTIKVRVEDVWAISESEVDSLLTQTEELVKPLEKSSYFAQGITLKSDIVVSLNKVKGLIKEGTTPEAKIKSYREAQLELQSAKEKIEKLKDMVSEADSSGSILGFVGGSQAIAVWGVVIAIATGFVFMTIYMRKLLGVETVKQHSNQINTKQKSINHNHNVFDKIAVFLVIATISGLVSSIAVKKLGINQTVVANQPREVVLGASSMDLKSLKVIKLVSATGMVKLYQDEGSRAVSQLTETGVVAIQVEKGEKRMKIILDGQEVWVENENVEEK